MFQCTQNNLCLALFFSSDIYSKTCCTLLLAPSVCVRVLALFSKVKLIWTSRRTGRLFIKGKMRKKKKNNKVIIVLSITVINSLCDNECWVWENLVWICLIVSFASDLNVRIFLQKSWGKSKSCCQVHIKVNLDWEGIYFCSMILAVSIFEYLDPVGWRHWLCHWPQTAGVASATANKTYAPVLFCEKNIPAPESP